MAGCRFWRFAELALRAETAARRQGATGTMVDKLATSCSVGGLAFVFRPIEEAVNSLQQVSQVVEILRRNFWLDPRAGKMPLLAEEADFVVGLCALALNRLLETAEHVAADMPHLHAVDGRVVAAVPDVCDLIEPTDPERN